MLTIILVFFSTNKNKYNSGTIKKDDISLYTKTIYYLRETELSDINNNLLYIEKIIDADKKYYLFSYINDDTLISVEIPLKNNKVFLDSSYNTFFEKTRILKMIPSPKNKQVTWDNTYYISDEADKSLKWFFTQDSGFDFSDYKYNNKSIDILKTSSFFIWGTIHKMEIDSVNSLLYKYNQDSSSVNQLTKINQNEVEIFWNNFVTPEKEIYGEIKISNKNDNKIKITIDGNDKIYSYNELKRILLPVEFLRTLNEFDKNNMSWDYKDYNSINYTAYLNLTINGVTWMNFINNSKDLQLNEFVLRALLLQLEEWNVDEIKLRYKYEGVNSVITVSSENLTNNNYLILIFILSIIGFAILFFDIIKDIRINRNNKKETDESDFENIEKQNDNEKVKYFFEKFKYLEENENFKEEIDELFYLLEISKKSVDIQHFISNAQESELLNTNLKERFEIFQKNIFDIYSEEELLKIHKMLKEKKIQLNENIINNIIINRAFFKKSYKKYIKRFINITENSLTNNRNEFYSLLIEIVILYTSYVSYFIDEKNVKNIGNVKIVIEEKTVNDLNDKYRIIFNPKDAKHHYSFVINIKNLLNELGVKHINYLVDGFDINNELN